MKQTPLVRTLLLVAAASFFFSGCVVRERVVYRPPPPALVAGPDEVVVSAPPPPPIQETVVVAPGPGYLWVRGGWVWRDRWVWQPGRWAYPPRPGARWRENRYEVRHGVRVYVGGGWVY